MPDVRLIRFENREFWYMRIYSREDKKNIFRVLNTESKEEARRVFPEIYRQWLINPNPSGREAKKTVIQLAEQWMEEVDQRVQRQEITENSGIAKKAPVIHAVIPYLIDKGLNKTSRLQPNKDFQGFVSWMMMKDYKRSTIKTYSKSLVEWTKWLYRKKHISDPVLDIELPRQTYAKQVEDRTVFAYTEDMIERIDEVLADLISSTEGHSQVQWKQVFWFYELMLASGCRTGEMYHIQFGDCQTKKSKSLLDKENLVHIRISKTGPRETIFMSSGISQLRKMYEEIGLKVERNTSLWANTTVGGTRPYTQAFFNIRFRKVLDEVGLSHDYRLYGMRATHITDAIERGVSTYILSRNLGTSEGQIRLEYEALLMRRQTGELFKDNRTKELEDDFTPVIG